MTWLDRLGCLFGFHWFGRWHLEYSLDDHEWFQWIECGKCGKRETRTHS